jgi:hypothetical protein
MANHSQYPGNPATVYPPSDTMATTAYVDAGPRDFVFAQLPATGLKVGMLVNITDASIATPGSAVPAGGGPNNVLTRWNGTGWIIVR